MLYNLGDALIPVLENAAGKNPALKDARPRTAGADTELAARRFERRLHSLGLSEQMARKAVITAGERIHRLNQHAESPIERALAPWLMCEDYTDVFSTVPPEVHIPKEDATLPKGDLIIIPQFAFARFRVDFAVYGVANGRRQFVAVECDGADYHAAPELQERDRKRDAYLRSWGIETIRATGEEVYTEPHKITGRVVDALLRAVGAAE